MYPGGRANKRCTKHFSVLQHFFFILSSDPTIKPGIDENSAKATLIVQTGTNDATTTAFIHTGQINYLTVYNVKRNNNCMCVGLEEKFADLLFFYYGNDKINYTTSSYAHYKVHNQTRLVMIAIVLLKYPV